MTKNEEKRAHLMAEHTSRYDLRCVRCGVSSTDPRAKEPCTAPPLKDERIW